MQIYNGVLKIGVNFSEKIMNFWVIFCAFVFLMAFTVSGNVVLIGRTITLSFEDIEANFSPSVKGFERSGILYVAQPLDACSTMTNKIDTAKNGTRSPFVLIIRGGCSFEEKVRRAQAAGFKAAIVYDNAFGALVTMAGNSTGVKIPAVFVSKASGEALAKFDGVTDIDLWIIPSFENSAWSIMAISFISLLAMSAMVATCFFVRRHRIRRERSRASHLRGFRGMSSRLVKAMPSLIFTAVLEDNCTSKTCAICLEDYSVGEKLRILPCLHKFHARCVDGWLTSWRTFCPVCKRNARSSTGDHPPASESTPLLSSSPASNSSSSALSSFRSSLVSSSAMRIAPPSSHSLSVSRPPSISSTPCNHQSLWPFRQSPHLSVSRSSVDLRNASAQRSRSCYLISSQSLGYPSISPFSSLYMYPYIPSPGNASSNCVGSSRQLQHPLHYGELSASFSPFASAPSLPGC